MPYLKLESELPVTGSQKQSNCFNFLGSFQKKAPRNNKVKGSLGYPRENTFVYLLR